MFTAIERCIDQLQHLGPKFESPELQNLTLRLIKELDTLERFRLEVRNEKDLAPWLPPTLRDTIDQQKRTVIHIIHELRRSVGLAIQLPTELYSTVFFELEGAEEPVS